MEERKKRGFKDRYNRMSELTMMMMPGDDTPIN